MKASEVWAGFQGDISRFWSQHVEVTTLTVWLIQDLVSD